MNIYKRIKLQDKYIDILNKINENDSIIDIEYIKKYSLLLGIFCCKYDREYLFQDKKDITKLINDILYKLYIFTNYKLTNLSYNNTSNLKDLIEKRISYIKEEDSNHIKKIIKISFETGYNSYDSIINKASIFDYLIGTKNLKEYKLIKSIYK